MYAITIQRHYYAGTLNVDRRELLLADDWTGSAEYPTRKAAQDYIDDISTVHLRHGEHSTPTLRVVKVATKRYAELRRRTYGG